MAGSLDGMAPLLAVDAPSLLFRAFYALPDSIRDGEGHSVNALLGTANLLLFEIERFAPRATVLCFGEEAAHYRTEAYAPYHADRVDVPDALTWQWSRAADFFGAFGFEIAVAEGLEADDLLGSYATVEAEAGGEALLLTGDRDMFQCASDRVRVLYVKTGGSRGAEEMGPKEVIARYGVPPEAVPDFIALRGDPSDGLPGAKGIGEKTAADVLRRHGTLEAALDNAIREKPGVRKALLADPDLLLAFKDIATLRHVPVKLPPDRPLDTGGRRRGGSRAGDEPSGRAAGALAGLTASGRVGLVGQAERHLLVLHLRVQQLVVEQGGRRGLERQRGPLGRDERVVGLGTVDEGELEALLGGGDADDRTVGDTLVVEDSPDCLRGRRCDGEHERAPLVTGVCRGYGVNRTWMTSPSATT